MLVNLVYISSAIRLMTDAELSELLLKSRQNNDRVGVTGMLLYKDGNFMQVLEGEELEVATVHARIMEDIRHKDILTLLRDPIDARNFGEWSMAFQNVDLLGDAERNAFSPFMNEPFTRDYFGNEPQKSMRLLQSFKKNMR